MMIMLMKALLDIIIGLRLVLKSSWMVKSKDCNDAEHVSNFYSEIDPVF